MGRYWILILGLGVTGCATHQPVARAPLTPATTAPVVREAAPSRLVETRYEVRAYRDPDNPTVRHDAHAVYRETRVPARIDALDVSPRNAFAPVSYAPLPRSAELTAEINAQRQITTELGKIKTRMLAIEQQAQGQYGTLVTQTAETVKLRQELEAERARVRELEMKMKDNVAASAAAGLAVTTETAEPKW